VLNRLWEDEHLTSPSPPQPDPDAKPNLNPIVTDPPKFVADTTNGKLYTVGDGEDLISLVHVWGEKGREERTIGRGVH